MLIRRALKLLCISYFPCVVLHAFSNIIKGNSFPLKKNRFMSMITETGSTDPPIWQPNLARVAFQGERGAYSEKCLRALLGPDVISVPMTSFEKVFRSLSTREVDYAIIPIENSLGGSIHANFDLLLRYELYIIGEYEFKVEHSLMALPGTKLSNIKKILSHEQALAQCNNYIRSLNNVQSVATYDTAGSAKMIAEGNMTDCAAIASALAAETYGLEILESNIEDDDTNFTRFLLLSLFPVSVHITSDIPAKTTVIFTLANSAGALYKALSCFSLRDIDCSKIESRPSSLQLLSYLRNQQQTMRQDDIPRFQYCFHLDFLSGELEDNVQCALFHLREMSPFMKVLGSYPRNGLLVGPVKDMLVALKQNNLDAFYQTPQLRNDFSRKVPPSSKSSGLNIGIIGFGKFGQFIAKSFAKHNSVRALGRSDKSKEAEALGMKFYSFFELEEFFRGLDVVVLSVSIVSFEEVLANIPQEFLRGKLVTEVLSVKSHPKKVLEALVPMDADILCSHPMFGPESGKDSWQGLPFVYEKVRTSNHERINQYLKIWEKERCKMVEMLCNEHDAYAANSQFITHLMGRILAKQGLSKTPIDTNAFRSTLQLMETTCTDSFDLFYGLYKYNDHSQNTLRSLRESFADVERQLARKEGYLAAKADMAAQERKNLLSERKFF